MLSEDIGGDMIGESTIQRKAKDRQRQGNTMEEILPRAFGGRWPCEGLTLRLTACTMLTEHISDSLGFLDYGDWVQ